MRIATLGICGLLLLTSCTSSGDDDDGPGPVADQLAEALAGKDLSGVPWRSTDTGRPRQPVRPAGRRTGRGRRDQVDEQDDQATATLAWTWDFSGNEWTYETPAALTKTGDEWKVTWAPTIVEPSLKEGETLDVDTLLAERGDILGAGGRRLVKARDVVHYGLDKTMVKAAGVASSARRIAQVLDIDPAPYVKQAGAAGPKAFVEAIVLRDADARKIDPSYSDIPGAAAVTGTLPLAPTADFAAPILGRVGPATAELIEDSDGALQEGDVVGLSGLQARYDEQLRGIPGVSVQAVDAEGAERPLYSFEPEAGEPLEITLDERLQLKAERILEGFGEGNPPNATAIVALRPSTGDVLVAANGPGTEGLNIATYGQYAPGSTFKIVSALALLRAGLTTEQPGVVPVDDRGGRQDLQELRRLPAFRSRRDHSAPGRRQLLQHRDHRPARQATRRRPGRRRCRPGGRRGPRPGLPGVLRPGPTARR